MFSDGHHIDWAFDIHVNLFTYPYSFLTIRKGMMVDQIFQVDIQCSEEQLICVTDLILGVLG